MNYTWCVTAYYHSQQLSGILRWLNELTQHLDLILGSRDMTWFSCRNANRSSCLYIIVQDLITVSTDFLCYTSRGVWYSLYFFMFTVHCCSFPGKNLYKLSLFYPHQASY